MPPPSLNPQGSRAGLITAVVVLSILFVTSAIFAFYFSAENNKKADTNKNITAELEKYAGGDRGDPAVTALVEAKNDEAFAGQSAIQVAVTRLGNLSKAITGNPNPSPSAEQQYANAIALAADKDLQAAGLQITANTSLADAIKELTTKLKSILAESQQKSEQLAAAADKLKAEADARAKMEADLNAKFEEQGKEYAAKMADLETKRTENAASVAKIQGSVDDAAKRQQAIMSQLQSDLTQRNEEVAKLKADIEVYKAKVPRPDNTSNIVVRQIDGKIVRVPGNDNVFIDLGEGDGVAAGLTFEVYDRYGGVPGVENPDEVNPTDEASFPKGKAAIEVIKPGRGQSECRIIRQSTSAPISEGDVIANLVYDRNTKYNFVVFGDFDLDQDGTPTPADNAVIKDRVQKWGGRLQDKVNVNCDFVVLGFEPEVPLPEENPSPLDIDRMKKAEEALAAYNDVVTAAKGLNIPILNQNRFLYYTGYYEQAAR